MRLNALAPLFATCALSAQGLSSGPAEHAWGVSMGFITAFGLGNQGTDTDDHPGFGLHLGAVYHASGRHLLRPAFEWTGYRIGPYGVWDRALSSVLDQGHRENRVVFRTYRLGLDYVIHQDPEGLSGAYLVLGCGGQFSHLYSDVRSVDAHGQETVEQSASRGSHTSLWAAAGVGRLWRSGGLVELRVSRADYASEIGPARPEGPRTREGYALTFVFGGRF